MQVERLIIIIFPFVFIAIWVFVIGLVSRFGGWWHLAQRYRAFDSYHGKRLRGRHGRFGGTSYGGVLTFGADMQGMYLAVNFLFSMWHPPLFILWKDIQTEEQKSFFTVYTTISFAQVPNVKLTISSKLMAQVQALKTGNLF